MQLMCGPSGQCAHLFREEPILRKVQGLGSRQPFGEHNRNGFHVNSTLCFHHVGLVFGMIHMVQQDAGAGACKGFGPHGPSLEDKVVGGLPGTWLGDAALHVCL